MKIILQIVRRIQTEIDVEQPNGMTSLLSSEIPIALPLKVSKLELSFCGVPRSMPTYQWSAAITTAFKTMLKVAPCERD